MTNPIHKLIGRKKVDISDIVSPRPSRTASRIVKAALQKSYVDQQSVRKKAAILRSN